MAIELLKIGKRLIEQTKLGEVLPPYYVFSGSLDTNIYQDITSNSNWISIGVKSYDYLFCRKQVMMWTSVNGFSGLTLGEKQIAIQNFTVGKSDRDTIYSDGEQKEFWEVFVENSQKARERRWKAAKAYISYLLTPADSTDLALATETLSKNYIEYGIESLAIDGVNGLHDWLENVYPSKGYYVEEHKNKIMDILKDGIYQ